jgi:predicted membrane protein
MFCPKCGAQFTQGRFCRSCGTNLEAVSDALDEAAPGRGGPRPQRGAATMALFTQQRLSNQATSLDGQQAIAIFGGVTLDLGAQPIPVGDTRISMVSIFSHSHIGVPRDVALRITGFSAFSNIDTGLDQLGGGIVSTLNFKSPGYDQAARRLHLDLSAIFGAIKITWLDS